MAGRPKKPAALKKGKSETQAELKIREEQEKRLMGNTDKVKEIPSYLDGLEQAYYKYLITELEIGGIIGNLDIAVLEETAICLSDMRKLNEQVKHEGIIIEQIDRYGNTVRKENPAFTAKQKLLKEFRAFSALLGLSPSSRAQLAGMKLQAKEEEEDPLLQLLKAYS